MERPGLVVRRALGHRLLVVAASATALFAVTVLAALGGYAASVTGEGLRTTLAGATFDGAGTRISTAVTGARHPRRAAEGRSAAIAKVYGHIPVAISLSARGDSYVVPGQERSAHPQLTTFATYSGIEAHARLTDRPLAVGRHDGRLSGKTVQTALPVAGGARDAARRPAVRSRCTAGSAARPSSVQVTGLFEARRADDYFWGGDRLVTTGVERLGYTTFGPLVVPPATFTSRFTTSVTARWLVLPSLAERPADRLSDVAARARALPAALGSSPPAAPATPSAPRSRTCWPRSTARCSSHGRRCSSRCCSSCVLAVYTLMLVARLLAEHRRVEVTLMRARGASGRQIAALAVGEGLLLSAPSAVAAPFLAPLLVRAAIGDAAARHVRTPPRPGAPTALTWGIAITAALACAAAITLPPLRGIRKTYVETVAVARTGRAARDRPARRGRPRAGRHRRARHLAARALRRPGDRDGDGGARHRPADRRRPRARAPRGRRRHPAARADRLACR